MFTEKSTLHTKRDPDDAAMNWNSNSIEDNQFKLVNIKTEPKDSEDISPNTYNSERFENVKQELIDVLNTTETDCPQTNTPYYEPENVDDVPSNTYNNVSFEDIRPDSSNNKNGLNFLNKQIYKDRPFNWTCKSSSIEDNQLTLVKIKTEPEDSEDLPPNTYNNERFENVKQELIDVMNTTETHCPQINRLNYESENVEDVPSNTYNDVGFEDIRPDSDRSFDCNHNSNSTENFEINLGIVNTQPENFVSIPSSTCQNESFEDIRQELIEVLNRTETQPSQTNAINIIDDNSPDNYLKFKKLKRHKWTRKHWVRGLYRVVYRIRFSDRIFCVSSAPQRRKFFCKINQQFKEGPEWENYIRQISGLCFVVNNENCENDPNPNLGSTVTDAVEDKDESMSENIHLNDLEDAENEIGKCKSTTTVETITSSNTETENCVRNYSVTIRNDFTKQGDAARTSTIELKDTSSKEEEHISDKNDEEQMSEDDHEEQMNEDEDEEQMSEGHDEADFLHNISVVVQRNISNSDAATKRVVNLEKNQTDDSFVNNVCVVIDNSQSNNTNELSDIAIIVDNSPIKNKTSEEWLEDVKRHEYLSAFQRICHRHFISENCSEHNCQLLHIIPKDFQNILENFDFSTLMKAYNWVKETMLFQHILPFFVNIFVDLKKYTELSDIIHDIFKQICPNKTESIKLVLKGLQALENTFSEALDFIILRHGVANIEICDALLKIIIENHNLKENWFLIKKLITFRTIKLPDCLVVKMISMCVSAPKPDVELCKNINRFIVNKNLANMEMIPNLFLRSFNKIVQM